MFISRSILETRDSLLSHENSKTIFLNCDFLGNFCALSEKSNSYDNTFLIILSLCFGEISFLIIFNE